MKSPKRPINLSDEVKALIDQGREGEAGNLLKQTHPWMDRKEVLRAVFDYRFGNRKPCFQDELDHNAESESARAPREVWTVPYALVNLGGILAFMWALINIFILIASLIILINIEGYREAEFRVNRTYYVSDSEDGDSWGIRGEIAGREHILADPALLPAEEQNTGYYLKQQYPAGAVIRVLYNPDVTGDAFQNRSVNVIAYSADPAAAEKQRISHWFVRCMLPFVAFVIASWMMRKTTTVYTIKNYEKSHHQN